MSEEMKENVHFSGRGLVDTFSHSLDPKKRLTIPSEWRDAMGNPDYVYVFPDAVEECLNLVPVREMETLFADLEKHDIFDSETDQIAQALARSAQMLRLDTAGRIRIGDGLLKFAGITGKVTLVGAFRKGKIWAAEKQSGEGGLDIAAYRAAVALRRKAAQKAGKA